MNLIKTEPNQQHKEVLNQNKKAARNNPLIQEIAIPLIQESTAALVLTALTLPVMATPSSWILLTACLSSTLARSFLICATQALSSYCFPQTDKWMPILTSYARAFHFSNLYAHTANILIHEGGHAVLANALYQQAKPSITLYPHRGGETCYRASCLSPLGAYLGPSRSRLLIAGAGIGFSLVTCLITTLVAHRMKPSHPNGVRYLEMNVIRTSYHNIQYALSALHTSKQNLSHDFIHLWVRGGLHPYFCIFCLLVTPILTKWMLVMQESQSLGRVDESTLPLKVDVHRTDPAGECRYITSCYGKPCSTDHS